MQNHRTNKYSLGFGLIGILIGLVIISFIIYKMIKVYSTPARMDQETSKTLSDQGIDATNYKTILDSVKTKVEDAAKKDAARLKEMENLQE